MKLSSRKPQPGATVELSMTSMIDVVFLLLIFFMTTASFVRTERHLDPTIQYEQKSASSTATDLEPVIVEVLPNASGEAVYKLGSREIQSLDELTSVLAQFDNKLDGAFVRVSDRVPFGMGASAVQACKTAKFVSVSYIPLESHGNR